MRWNPADPAPARALLVEGVHPEAEQALVRAGWETRTVAHSPQPAELAELLDGVRLLGIRSTTRVSASTLEAADGLEAVGAFCIGTNQIDVDSAADRGVAVFNAPFSNTRSVVELAVAEIIALTRRLPPIARGMSDGRWEKSSAGSHEVRGRRLGIVGYGNIGSQLSVVAEALGMHVSYFDVVDRLPLGNASPCDRLEDLLEHSDVVSLHVDGRPANSGLFGEEQFRRMRPGAIFMNLSRGFVVDLPALRVHLESGHLAGAAVDVFPGEPQRRRQPFDSELRGLPNVILTPHIGGSTEEAQRGIGRFVARKLTDYERCGDTALSVNMPQLAMPGRPDALRVTHLHRNVPGALARLNRLFAAGGADVVGQQVATRGELSYVMSDVLGCGDATIGTLSRAAGTVRVRRPGPAERLDQAS